MKEKLLFYLKISKWRHCVKYGKEYERKLLGCLFKVKKAKPTPYWEAVRFVEKVNIRKLRPTPFIMDLRYEVAKALCVNQDKVFVCTSVDSSFDKFHGVDAFIIFRIGGVRRIVTIDITTNPHKRKKDTKADLLFYSRRMENVFVLASEIAYYLMKKARVIPE